MTKEAITPIGSTGKRDPAALARRYSEQLAAAAEESSYREVPANLRHLSQSSDCSGRPSVVVHGVPVGFPTANPMGSHLGLIAAAQATKPGLVSDNQALVFRANEASHDLERVRPTASGSPLAVDFASSPLSQLLTSFLHVNQAEVRIGLPHSPMAAIDIDDMAAIARSQLNYDLMALLLLSATAKQAQQRLASSLNELDYEAGVVGDFMGIRQCFSDVKAGNDETARTNARHLERAYTRALSKPAHKPLQTYDHQAQIFTKDRVPNSPTAVAAAIQKLSPKTQAALALAGQMLASPSLLLALADAIIGMATQKVLACEQRLALPVSAPDKKVRPAQVPRDRKQNNEDDLRALLAYLTAAKDILEAQEANKEEQSREYARRKDDEHRQDDEKMREKTRVVRDLSVAIHRVSMFKGKAALSPSFSVMLEKELAALSQAAAALSTTTAASATITTI